MTIIPNKYLENKNVLLTRSIEAAEESSKLFSELGARVFFFPTLDFKEAKDYSLFDKFVMSGEEIDFIIFTSINSVKYFRERLRILGRTLNYDEIVTVAIGKKTASVCKESGIPVSYISRHQNAIFLAEYFDMIDVNKKCVLYPSSNLANSFLTNFLAKRGANIKTFVLYETTLPSEELIEKYTDNLNSLQFEWIIFTSPSSFRNFLTIAKHYNTKNVLSDNIVSIGETTSSEIMRNNYKPVITASENSMEGIVESIINYYKSKGIN
ncbi:MAG: uroporphyrinogen-III synthase [Ignavibacteriaceae bacterium]